MSRKNCVKHCFNYERTLVITNYDIQIINSLLSANWQVFSIRASGGGMAINMTLALKEWSASVGSKMASESKGDST